MKKFTTAQRLKQVMDARNMKQVDILDAAKPYCKKYNIKLGKNALSQYLSGKVEPGQEKLTILGLALGVSEAWLMGYEVPMERNVTPTIDNDDGRMSKIIELAGLLSADQKDLIINVIKGILSAR